MKKFSQYGDALIIFAALGLFVLGGIMAYQRWHVSQDKWRTNFEQSSINPEDIRSGGMGRDENILPIDNPRFESVTMAERWLDARTPVIVVSVSDSARAYPLTVMLAHEVVNDHFADLAIVVTYCPLCNSPIVYEREIEGRVLRMGVTGNFYGNNFLMYDDYSESWWHQFTGEAVVGDYTGTVLEVVPSQVVGFQNFAERYPDGEVLAGDERFPQQHYTMNPYINAGEESSSLMSREDYDSRLPAMARILGVNVDGIAVAYPFPILQRDGVVNDTVNGKAIVVFWQTGAAGVLDAMTIENSRDVGQAAIFGRMVQEQELNFIAEAGRIFDQETNSEWNIFGEAIAGELSGAELEQLTSFAQFWFAWASAYPDTEVYGLEQLGNFPPRRP